MASHRLASRTTLRCTLQRLEAETEDLACQLVRVTRELDDTGVTLTGAWEDRRAAEERAQQLAGRLAHVVAELHALRAEHARCGAVTVPRWVRDTSDPADQATAPIPAGERWADPARPPAPPTPAAGVRVISLQQRGPAT
ncbi:hypothetical protein [Streptomyces boncukensis]|uniref:Uncharacterized protein n=1 Tax=Streptomyces boncukensis TaxID=2711219 RepID=A0A6G4WVA2_9ACTN|nr:hypothetical protein [Streptomyces boncukensis]NGO69155.1 hypothetical protein [Streptomyces boncukensis]